MLQRCWCADNSSISFLSGLCGTLSLLSQCHSERETWIKARWYELNPEKTEMVQVCTEKHLSNFTKWKHCLSTFYHPLSYLSLLFGCPSSCSLARKAVPRLFVCFLCGSLWSRRQKWRLEQSPGHVIHLLCQVEWLERGSSGTSQNNFVRKAKCDHWVYTSFRILFEIKGVLSRHKVD